MREGTLVRKSLFLLSLIGFSMLLSACTATRFAYPNEPGNFTVLAAATSPAESDKQAYYEVSSVCKHMQMVPRVTKVDRVPNSIDCLNLDGRYLCLAKYYQRQDYLTIMQATCQKPVQPVAKPQVKSKK